MAAWKSGLAVGAIVCVAALVVFRSIDDELGPMRGPTAASALQASATTTPPRVGRRRIDVERKPSVDPAPAKDPAADLRRRILEQIALHAPTGANETRRLLFERGRLEKDEMEKHWNRREVETPRRASYGSGSFVVTKLRRPPLARDEDWWAGADAATRAAWITSDFVETSGYFRIDSTENVPCPACGGRGGACRDCNGCGEVRMLVYR